MELAEGESLAALLARNRRLEPAEAVRIAAQCADALHAAHVAGIVHRDVKPGNIMLTAKGAKLVDFGIATTPGGTSLTLTGRIVGTAAYLAPERASGRPSTPAADLYALGVVLYQMLAGRLPFRADDPVSMMYAHVATDPLPLPGDVPAALAGICRSLLAKEPQGRPGSGAALAIMLRKAPLDVDDRAEWRLETLPHTFGATAPMAALGTGTASMATGMRTLWRPRPARSPGPVARRRRGDEGKQGGSGG